MAAYGKASIKKDLTARIKARGGDITAIDKSLIDQYVSAWERSQSDPENIGTHLAVMKLCLEQLGVEIMSSRRQALMDELMDKAKARGMTGTMLTDSVDRFMQLWDAFQEASKSLKTRGRSYMSISSAGKEYEKDNSAVKDIINLSRAMQDQLKAMDISMDGYDAADDDDL